MNLNDIVISLSSMLLSWVIEHWSGIRWKVSLTGVIIS